MMCLWCLYAHAHHPYRIQNQNSHVSIYWYTSDIQCIMPWLLDAGGNSMPMLSAPSTRNLGCVPSSNRKLLWTIYRFIDVLPSTNGHVHPFSICGIVWKWGPPNFHASCWFSTLKRPFGGVYNRIHRFQTAAYAPLQRTCPPLPGSLGDSSWNRLPMATPKMTKHGLPSTELT